MKPIRATWKCNHSEFEVGAEIAIIALRARRSIALLVEAGARYNKRDRNAPQIAIVSLPPAEKRVLVCQNRSCRKSGSDRVLAAFQEEPVEGAIVEASGCLGQCGNGPMVLVLPDEIWYWQVRPYEVSAMIERHLRGGQPVKGMLYPKFHSG